MKCFVWLAALQALVWAAGAQRFCDGDCYDLMQLTQRATKDDIKKAYKKFSLELHPDRGGGEAAEAKFKKIARAYEVLVDDKMRRKYDYAIRNPGWRDMDGDFGGGVDGKMTFVILLVSVAMIALLAVKFLNVMDFFAKPQKVVKKPKKVKNGAGKSD